MFTGIIETVGEVSSFENGSLRIQFPDNTWQDPLQIGESIAVNGCCLTAIQVTPDSFLAQLSPETILRTSFSRLGVRRKVNLERAMKADGRFGGHIVQGHVDGVGSLVSIQDESNAKVARFRIPLPYATYLIDKCSIAIEGISLTVVNPTSDEFEVWVIPHTWENTSLHQLSVGDFVNFEVDIIARYVEKLVQNLNPKPE